MQLLLDLLPSAGTVAAAVMALWIVHRFLERGGGATAEHRFRNQILMLLLTAAGVLVVILVIPMGDARRGQVLSLIGILLSAAIALSSTTILGNAMAGFMLRVVRNFRAGDFIRTGEYFGRVSERGLFHTEIQTEDRELTTLPNLYLVTHPVTTVRTSGTMVSATVSLGYDVSRSRIEALLIDAAGRAGLADPFVHVLDLGDFSVTYRVAGMLTEVKQLLSTRSRLRKRMLDTLHEDGVEIVSPTFMNTRGLDPGRAVLPPATVPAAAAAPEPSSEDVVFDKAEEAESLETLRATCKDLKSQIEAQEDEAKKAAEGPDREKIERKLDVLRRRKERLDQLVTERAAKHDEG